MILLTLPWPDRRLSPNSRGHWRELAKAKQSYRSLCALTARSQGATPIPAERLRVHMTFVAPDRRRRDLDNLIASMKSGLDGLADVLRVDDNRWALGAELGDGTVPGGQVLVTVGAI
ncbi:MAG: hypothetical protein RLZZ373_2624 [Pseudomonadota bacterium]|jgi:crossover junction endodeoxyribonuclease RusA